MNRRLVISKLFFIIVFFSHLVYASEYDISRANFEMKTAKRFGLLKPVVIQGEMHKVKNKKGQIRRVWARAKDSGTV